jgi:hypothetical protein
MCAFTVRWVIIWLTRSKLDGGMATITKWFFLAGTAATNRAIFTLTYILVIN